MLASDDPAGELILALKSESWNMRESAEDALNEIGDPLLLALIPVCNGETVLAAPYNPETPKHPLVYMTPNGEALRWTYEFLEEWGPASRQINEVQLVACAKERSRTIETCSYNFGSKRIRIQESISIVLQEAASGTVIESLVFNGPMPKKCPSALSSSSSGETRTISGGLPDENEIRDFLAGYYE